MSQSLDLEESYGDFSNIVVPQVYNGRWRTRCL